MPKGVYNNLVGVKASFIHARLSHAKKMQEKDAEIERLKKEIEELRSIIHELQNKNHDEIKKILKGEAK